MNAILPNFFCGGAPKAGTTTIYDILKGHPDICLSSFKEPRFFNDESNFNKGLKWYLDSYFGDYKNQPIIADFTPTYLANEFAPQRIKETIGENAKFVFILRHPVDRAYSHYLHNRRDQKEELSFEEALKVESQRTEKYLAERDFVNLNRFEYVRLGLYSDDVKRYQDIFGRENVRVYIFEECFKDVRKTIIDLLKFLNIDYSVELQTDKISNQSSKARLKFVKKILNEKSIFKSALKIMIPSEVMRRKMRNKLQSVNNKPVAYGRIDSIEKSKLLNMYFKGDLIAIEENLGVNLDVWRI